MHDSLRTLRNFFPTGTTEGELALLEDAFVVPMRYADAIAPPAGSPRLLVGRKGTGKTAIVEYLQTKMSAQGVPALLLRPDDIELEVPAGHVDLGTIKRSALRSLISSIASKLGSELTGFVRGSDVELLKQALRDGEAVADLVQSAARVLMPVGKAVTGIDFASVLPEHAHNAKQLKRAIAANLGHRKTAFYLCIDDTDQISGGQLDRIWGLLLAVRQLSQECPNVVCVTTLRTEVWMRLQWDGGGHKDQVDHFEPLAVDMSPTDNDIKKIVERRIKLAWQHATGAGSAKGARKKAYSLFFQDDSVRLPDSDQERAWIDFFLKNARGRPRDAIQLVRKLADSALELGDAKISSKHVQIVMASFSRERVNFVAEEYAKECPVLHEIIRSLAKISFEGGSLSWVAKTEVLLTHLRKIPSMFSVSIRNRTLREEQADSAFQIWRLLHESGIVNALVPDSRQHRNFRHINYADDPNLVSATRINELQQYLWEIHPTYRSYLREIVDADAAQLGLSRRDLLLNRRPQRSK